MAPATLPRQPTTCTLAYCEHPATVRARLRWVLRTEDATRDKQVDLCPRCRKEKEEEFSRPGDLFEIVTTY